MRIPRVLGRLLLLAGLLACLVPASALGEGVNTATGAFVTQTSDLSLTGLGVNFDLQRTYNSNAAVGLANLDDPLGPRWRHAYETGVSVDADGNVTVTATDGQQAVFMKDGSDYTTPNGINSTLTLASGTYTLTTPDGHQTLYDATSGHVTSMIDRYGHGLSFGYSSGRLATVTDAAGREADLAYTSIGGHYRLTSVTLPDSREVTYTYGADYLRNLASVTDAADAETDYTYSADARAYLATITDPNSNVVLSNTYDDRGRVIEQDDALDNATTYSWDDSGDATVVTTTKPNGATYTDTYRGNLLLVATDPLNHSTLYGYDDSLRKVQVIDARSVETDLAYDSAGNLTETSVPSMGITETRTYNASNELTSVTNANGDETSYVWNSGLLSEVHNADGGVSAMTYNGDSQLETITDPRGKTTTYGYDADFNRTSATTEAGRVSHWAYDGSGRMSSATNADGGVTTYAYDEDNRVTSRTDPRSHETTYAYDADGNLLTVTDPASGTTTTTYDDLGRPLTVTDADAHATTSAYDEVGDLVSVTDPTGAETTHEYDLAGQLTATTTPRGNETGATAADYTWHYSYDPTGNRTVVEDPTGAETTTTYDGLDRATAVEDPLGKTTTLAYDDAGNRTSVTDPNSNQTTTTFDEMGRPLATTSPEGRTTTRAYDDAGNLVSLTDGLGHQASFTYDGDGFLASSVDPRGNEVGATPSDFRTTYTRDDAGQVTEVEDPLGHTVTTTYDDAGNVASVTDQNGHTTSYGYDALDRVSSVTRSGSEVTGFTYDAVGNQLTRTDANSNTTTFAYDDADRPTSTTVPTGEQTTTAYDAEGNPITTVTGRGNASMSPASGTISRSFDALGRLTGIDYGDATPDVALSYDADGRLTQMDDGPGTQTYAYDDDGRLTGVTRGSDSFGYGYDGDGLITSRTQPGSVTIGATYDDAGRLASVTAGGVTSTYTYDAAGDLTASSLPSGTGYATDRSFDHAGRLTAVTNTNGTILSKFEQTLDPVGNPTRIDTTRGGSTTSQAFTYDANDRLSEWCPSAANCTSPSAYTSFSYDGVGNRTQQVRVGVSDPGTTSYAYDDSNRMSSSTIGVATTSYAYDADGNETQAGATAMTYDLANRMTSIDDGTTSTSFLYDGQGNRVRATTGSAQVRYLWDLQNANPELAIERDASNALIRRYVEGPGGAPRSMSDGSGTSYYLPDQLGSTADLIKASGTAESRYAYEPFGQTTETQLTGGAPDNPVRFAGEYQDPSGQYFLRARQYDPGTGRFTATDPVDLNDAGSAYAYVANRPGVLIDPSGMLSIGDVTGAIGSGAGAVGDVGAGVASGTFNAGAGAVETVGSGAVRVGQFGLEGLSALYHACDDIYATQGDGLEGRLACISHQNIVGNTIKAHVERASRLLAAGCWRDFALEVGPDVAAALLPEAFGALRGAEALGLGRVAETGFGRVLRGVRGPLADGWAYVRSREAQAGSFNPFAPWRRGSAGRAVRPAVTDTRLGRALADDLRGGPNPIGDGSALDAARHTVETGDLIGGSTHLEKVVEMRDRYARILRRGGLSPEDQAVAQSRYNAYHDFAQEHDLDAMMKARGLR